MSDALKLNADQSNAVESVLEFYATPGQNFLVIEGWAGVGKTTVIQRAIKALLQLHPNIKISLTAPTHKAVKVLLQMAEEYGLAIEGKTIYSSLGLVLDNNDEIKYAKRMQPGAFETMDLVVIDEGSMLNSSVWGHIEQTAVEKGVKVIVMGDSFQLPPVKEKISLSFTRADVRVKLTKIMRQEEGNPILELAASLREDIANGTSNTKFKPAFNHELDQGIFVMNAIDWYKSVEENFISDDYKKDPDLFRCLAWTNKRVNALNKALRRRIVGETVSPYIAGERILTRAPVFEDITEQKPMIVMNTDEEAEVIHIQESEHPLHSGMSVSFKTWETLLLSSHGTTATVYIIHNDSLQDYKDMLNLLSAKAKKDGSQWKHFWGFKESFADLQSPHAMTVHRCVHPDTLTITDQGMLPIKLLDNSGDVATFQGVAQYEGLVHNPKLPGLKFTCDNGLGITVKDDHLMKVFRSGEWEKVPAYEVSEGDWFRVRLGNDLDVNEPPRIPGTASVLDVRAVEYTPPERMSEDLAEFLGIMVADGTIHKRGNLFRITKRHKDFVERCSELISSLFSYQCPVVKDTSCNMFKVEVCSVHLCGWLESVGGMSANRKAVPEIIMRSPLRFQKAFLRGLFEDGGVNMKGDTVDHIELCAKYRELMDYAQQILFRVGIVSTVVTRNYGHELSYLYIYGAYCEIFKKEIGFITSFKNERLKVFRDSDTSSKVPVTPEFVVGLFKSGWINSHEKQSGREKGRLTKSVLRRVDTEEVRELLKWHYVKVKDIARLECESMCITVPEIESFLQNGQDHSNSQGSTYENVFVDVDDCFQNKNQLERNKLLYVACSRASKNLLLLRR